MEWTVDDFEILISIYGGECPLFFEECINSIEEDSNAPNVRLIIDGPLNNALEEIILGLNEDRWTIQRLKLNSGLSTALNEGVGMSKKTFLVRLDTDDLWVKNRCQEYIKVLEEARGELDVIGGFAALIDQKSVVHGIKKVPLNHEDIIKSMWKCPFIHPSVAIRRDVLAINPYNSKAGKRQDDYDLWYRLKAANARFINIDRVLVKYRYTYDNWRRNDIRVAIDRSKVLLRNEGIGVFTIAVSAYLLFRSCLTFRWVFILDNKLKNIL